MNSTMIQRPLFHEGQLLGPEDLGRLLEYPRDQDARHERYLHTWGIAHGLSVKEQNGEFALQPGFAIDSSGAPVIVAKPVFLDVDQLDEEALPSKQDDRKLFPLFVVRAQEEQSGDGLLGSCSNTGTNRIIERATVRFRPFATDWDKQPAVDVSEGPVDRPESDRVVLIGFVEWRFDPALPKGRIASFHRRDDSTGIGPRYAGVAADEVVGRGGELKVWSKSPGTQDAPVVVVGDYDKSKDEKAFAIGLDDGKGNINNVLTVDPKGNVQLKGNLNAAGAIKGQIRSGEVAIESGVASDGLTLPLPTGIDTKRVETGEIVVHATVTPRLDPKADQRLNDDYIPAVTECDVDEKRLVRCSIRWFKVTGEVINVPGSVNYTVMASVAASEGGDQ